MSSVEREVGVRCPECGKQFKNMLKMLDHFYAMHEGLEFRCQYCERTFGTYLELRDHIEDHAFENQERQPIANTTKKTVAMPIRETSLEIENYKEKLRNLASLYAEGKISEQSYLISVKTIENKMENICGNEDNPIGAKPGSYSISHQGEEYRESRTSQNGKPSAVWYIVSLFFGLIGGIIGYVAVRDRDTEMADAILVVGVFTTIFAAIGLWLYFMR